MTEPATPNHKPSVAGNSTLARTKSFLRTQYWIWPLVAAAILVFVGVFVRRQMEEAMKSQIADNLQTILNSNTEALRAWVATMQSRAEALAEDTRVRDLAGSLAPAGSGPEPARTVLLGAVELGKLKVLLQPELEHYGFSGYVLLNREGIVVAAEREDVLAMKIPPAYTEQLRACFEGRPLVTPPFPSVVAIPGSQGAVRPGTPTMFAAAPVRSAEGNVFAVLCLRIAPEKDFTRILATARAGHSGETYAFDRRGILLSESRFDDELKRLGLVPDNPESHSLLTLELRDPLVDLGRGGQSPKRRAEQPLIRPVAAAIAGEDGVDVSAYRDYRGRPSVGAWRWLKDFDMGLVSELEMAEALAPLQILRFGFGIIFGLLVLAALGLFLLMRTARRLHETARKAELKARQLGQYALDDQIGAGAYGAVYRAHHALMRRPVAVKLLDPARANEHSIARFEREVQLTCTLTHPNTIALYDYGRTPDGLFYYAMEFLEGLPLDKLVQKTGRLPEGRVIHVLRQVCSSLAEAHAHRLVHRDIKPANIFLTQRGGIPDFVKVLDFGIVKARNLEGQPELTGASATPGTPLYMSPEAIQRPDSVDARSDIYSLGCVGYYLLTGETVFGGSTLGELLLQHVRAAPEKPSVRLHEPVSRDLEQLILSCLAKKPEQRPASAEALEASLGKCGAANSWNREQAAEWWGKYEQRGAATTVLPDAAAVVAGQPVIGF